MYRIDRKFIRPNRDWGIVIFLIGFVPFIFFHIWLMSLWLDGKVFEGELEYAFIFVWFICGCIMSVGGDKLRRYLKCAKKYDYLEKYGTLLKAPYHLMPTFRFGYKNILVAKVKLKNGNSIELVKEKRLAENELNPSQEFVDVLIDLDNPNNYYIDFHIEEY